MSLKLLKRCAWPAVLAAGCAAGAGAPADPAPLDLSRYMGRWYVIAEFPARDGEVGAFVDYRLEGGRVEQLDFARAGSFDGDARLLSTKVWEPDAERPAQWREASLWFGEERRILYVSADYRYAAMVRPDGTEMRLLAREPRIPEWTYAGLLARLAVQDYEVARLRRVPQQ